MALSLLLSWALIFVNADWDIQTCRGQATEKENFDVKELNVLDKNISTGSIGDVLCVFIKPCWETATAIHLCIIYGWLPARTAELPCNTDNMACKA